MEENTSSSIWGRVIFFAFLAIVLVAFYYFSRPEAVLKPGEGEGNASLVGGQIAFIDGVAEYKSADGIWKRASLGTTVKEGDSVEVIGSGKAIISLDDGSAIRLNSGSAATLASLKSDNFIILNDKGQVYTRVAYSEKRIFIVKTGDVAFQSVGTAYKTINTEKIKGIEVYDSKVKVLGSSDKEVLVEEGYKYYVENKNNTKLEKSILKISTTDKDAFVKWNIEQDKQIDEEQISATTPADTLESEPVSQEKILKTTEPVKTIADDGAVKFITVKSLGGGKIGWTLSGYSQQGFKVVWSKTAHPTYPTRSSDKYNYYSSPDARSSVLDSFAGSGTYYVRVCEYLGGKCGVYSNEITISLESLVEKNVTSILLTSLGGGSIKWDTAGFSDNGYKVVWSKNSGPTYPTRDGDRYQFYSEPAQNKATVDAFDGSGDYFVRVCEYLSGICGVYSNEIKISL